jgi:hypothetical protein
MGRIEISGTRLSQESAFSGVSRPTMRAVKSQRVQGIHRGGVCRLDRRHTDLVAVFLPGSRQVGPVGVIRHAGATRNDIKARLFPFDSETLTVFNIAHRQGKTRWN